MDKKAEDFLREAEELYEKMGEYERYVGEDSSKRYWYSEKRRMKPLRGSLSKGILLKLMGKDGEFNEVLEWADGLAKEGSLIKEHFTFGIHRGKTIERDYIDTETNAILGILYKLGGREEEARSVYYDLMPRVKSSAWIIDGHYDNYQTQYNLTKKSTIYHPDYSTHAWMGVFDILMGNEAEAESLLKTKEKHAATGGNHFKEGELYGQKSGYFGDESRSYTTTDNASMAILLHLLWKNGQADRIIDAVENQIGKINGVFRSEMGEKYRAPEDSIYTGIYYCLKAGKKLTGKGVI